MGTVIPSETTRSGVQSRNLPQQRESRERTLEIHGESFHFVWNDMVADTVQIDAISSSGATSASALTSTISTRLMRNPSSPATLKR